MEEETKESFTADGYLKSGDIGMFDEELRFLGVWGRRKIQKFDKKQFLIIFRKNIMKDLGVIGQMKLLLMLLAKLKDFLKVQMQMMDFLIVS